MGRKVALTCLALCSVAAVLGAITCRDAAVECWYVLQLKSESATRRRAAAERLGEIGSLRALSPLMKVVEEDGDRIVRKIAVLSLIELALREDLRAVLARLDKKSE